MLKKQLKEDIGNKYYQNDIKELNPDEVYFKDGTDLIYKIMYDKINELIMKVNKMEKEKKQNER